MPPLSEGLAAGTQITYAREDSGIDILNERESVALMPGRLLTVSDQPGRGNVSAVLAARLVEDKVCTVTFVPPVAEEAKVAEEAPSQAPSQAPTPEEPTPEEPTPDPAGTGARVAGSAA